MTTPKKIAKVGLCVSAILLVSIVAVFSLSATPSSEMATAPTTRITTVFRNLGGLQTEYTKIDTVEIMTTDGGTLAIFSATDQTRTAEVGTELIGAKAMVFIGKEHASDISEAEDYTRVTITIKDPTDATVFSEELNSFWLSIERANHWEVPCFMYSGDEISHTLVEGTYTITTTYEIYT